MCFVETEQLKYVDRIILRSFEPGSNKTVGRTSILNQFGGVWLTEWVCELSWKQIWQKKNQLHER